MVKKISACQCRRCDSIPRSGRFPGEGNGNQFQWSWASLIAQLIKNPPAMQEILVWFLGQEDPLEKERLPTPVFWPGEFHGLYSPWGRKESGTPEQLSLSSVVLPGQFHRQKSLMGYSPWGHKGLDMTECIHAHKHTHTTYATRCISGRETTLLFLWSLCALRKDWGTSLTLPVPR